MARSRSSQDVVGFRRIFVLFCTLVLLPAMMLSGFGVVAIGNEREASKQRQRERAEAVLQQAEQRLASALDRVRDAVGSAAGPEAVRATRQRGLPIGPVAALSLDGEIVDGEPPFIDSEGQATAAVATLKLAASGLAPGEHAYVSLEAAGIGAAIAGVYRRADGRLLGYMLDPEGIAGTVRELASERSEFIVDLGARKADTLASGGLPAWVARLGEQPLEVQNALIAETRLGPPFERYSLQVRGPEPSQTGVVVYIVLLLVFYATLITGVVITSRLIWRETKLSRLKTDFVSHVSHELRTPLTSIRMFIETLRLGRATSAEEQQECLELLTRETERLSEMIERVLGYARLRSGRRIFNAAEVPVAELVDDALAAFRAHLVGGGATLELVRDLPEGLPGVVVDREAMIEALLNLLGNAYKYTGEEKRIRIFAQLGKKRRVVIGVEDNGPGLEKHEFGRIFDRFYQAGAELLSRPSSGSGLGLAITRAIVEGNNGRISVESEVGRGTTFLIELRGSGEPAERAVSDAEAAGTA